MNPNRNALPTGAQGDQVQRPANLDDVRRARETREYLRKHAPHPLEASVIEVFRKRSPQDRTTLAMGLADPDPWAATLIKFGPGHPRSGVSPNRAYQVVAEDVLGWMHSQGKVIRDDAGWYRLAPALLDPTILQSSTSEGAAPDDQR